MDISLFADFSDGLALLGAIEMDILLSEFVDDIMLRRWMLVFVSAYLLMDFGDVLSAFLLVRHSDERRSVDNFDGLAADVVSESVDA